jgi:hypothetical protein
VHTLRCQRSGNRGITAEIVKVGCNNRRRSARSRTKTVLARGKRVVPWAAVRHADDHTHIFATQVGRIAAPSGPATTTPSLRRPADLEHRYGLSPVTPLRGGQPDCHRASEVKGRPTRPRRTSPRTGTSRPLPPRQPRGPCFARQGGSDQITGYWVGMVGDTSATCHDLGSSGM